ncbi:hypothetical protein GGS23DRAFT_324865 [Durotheca rogersii]|uniref:uncharacterized protein n=1 Tax=Durotheca rogersii TaxID=419775 RepID=UPI00221E484B|nr:uncharacterized protein GGS23DRAFT_324865 [Durotheca rogersii]KAI5859379.1 hypothetical protein GGS23DRAFT_324865 [Durotheca rogersii]
MSTHITATVAPGEDYAVTLPSEPGRATDPRVVDFVRGFYAVSDDPARDGEWVAHFLPDAELIIGGATARSTQEIRELRQSMWAQVAARKHALGKLFPASFAAPPARAGPGTDMLTPDPEGAEFMLFGTVARDWRGSGRRDEVPWAARAVLREAHEDEGETQAGKGGGAGKRLKFAFYQVYM